jgi:hypothetical protein
MIEYKTEREIVAFDGRVIERFGSGGTSLHFHIDFIKSVEIYADKKGQEHFLRINFKDAPGSEARSIPDQRLSPNTIPQAQAFVDEVMRVIASREK